MNIISKQKFIGQSISVYGTFENPLFNANDVGNILEIGNIRDRLNQKNMKGDFLFPRKYISVGKPDGKKRAMNFVTEKGLYFLAFRSNNPKAIFLNLKRY